MAGNRRLLIGAVLLLVVGTVGLLVAPKFFGPPATPVVEPKLKQVVAKEDIPPHTDINKEMFDEVTVPTLPGNVATSLAEVDGKISVKKIEKGKPVLKDAFAASSTGVSVAHFAIPEGKRAMAIMVDTETGVGSLVVEGDHVDVIVFYKMGEDTVARVVAQNITVLATELTVAPPPPAAPPAGSPDAAKAAAAPTAAKKLMRIVLAVTADQAQQLVAAKDKGGELIPVLRNPKSSEMFAQLSEVWEHPRNPHVHFGTAVPNSPRKGDPKPVMVGLGPGPGPIPPMGSRGKIVLPPMPEGVDVKIIRGSEKPEIQTVPK